MHTPLVVTDLDRLAHHRAAVQRVHVPRERPVPPDLDLAGVGRAQQRAQILQHVRHDVEVGREQGDVGTRVPRYGLVLTKFDDVAVGHYRPFGCLPAKQQITATRTSGV